MPAPLLVLASASMATEGLGQEHGLPGIRVHCPALIYTDQETQHSHRAAAHVENRDGSHSPVAQQGNHTSVFTQKQNISFNIFVKLFSLKQSDL